MKRLFIAAVMAAGLTMWGGTAAFADGHGTTVPGHADKDSGVVMGKYTALYAYDASGAWYYDLGDGRVQGTASSVADLDEATLSVCDYQVIYQGDFGGDPFLDTGWIRNNVKCSGYDGTSTYNTLFVHESDHRYSEDLEPIWGTWGYFVNTESGVGNTANPHHHVGS